MGFEPVQVARRRLALVAAQRLDVQVALDGDAPNGAAPNGVALPRAPLAPLEELAREILDTPGAGSALLAAYASQARALALVLEVVHRSEHPPLPLSVVHAVRQAMTTVAPLPTIPLSLVHAEAPPRTA